jgi:hypothetical protein
MYWRNGGGPSGDTCGRGRPDMSSYKFYFRRDRKWSSFYYNNQTAEEPYEVNQGK